MGDLENRLRREATRHANAYSPPDDLADRIRARLQRARRRHRRRVVALSSMLAATALAVAGALVTGPTGDGSLRTADGHDPTRRTAPEALAPSTPSIPGADAPTATSEPSPTTTPPAHRPLVDPPATGPTGAPSTTTTTGSLPTTSLGTTTTATPLKPPDSQQPAAGTCGPASGSVAEITLNPDVPSPRCTQVRSDQTLRVRNASGQQTEVALANFSAELAPGMAQTFDQPFGSYLAPGVHRVSVSLYGSSGPELWLVS